MTKRLFKYLEKNGGRLTQSMVKTKWPDGSVTDFAWQYSAGSLAVLAAKTAEEAIRLHQKISKKL